MDFALFFYFPVGDDYKLSNRRVELLPGVNDDTGQVQIRIVNDHYPEDDEDLVVHLELKSGLSASVDSSASSTIVVIIGDQGIIIYTHHLNIMYTYYGSLY